MKLYLQSIIDDIFLDSLPPKWQNFRQGVADVPENYRKY